MFRLLRRIQRKRLASRPFPPEWEPIIATRLPFAARFDAEEAALWRTHLKVFVWEKHWIGARGLEVTEAMKVIVAGQAARLTRRLPLDMYDRLTEIVIYPSHYKHPGREGAIIYGEAHHWGTVVLSWDAVEQGILHPSDGHDTALHEFAHVLDVADGWFDGTPQLHAGRDFHEWGRVLGRYFTELQDRPEHGIVRAYGATNEAEFFAVATEAFFERPKTLRRKAPTLYQELRRFYRVDPARLPALTAPTARTRRDPKPTRRRKRR